MSVKQAVTTVPNLQSASIHRDRTPAHVTVALQAMVSSAQVCKNMYKHSYTVDTCYTCCILGILFKADHKLNGM